MFYSNKLWIRKKISFPQNFDFTYVSLIALTLFGTTDSTKYLGVPSYDISCSCTGTSAFEYPSRPFANFFSLYKKWPSTKFVLLNWGFSFIKVENAIVPHFLAPAPITFGGLTWRPGSDWSYPPKSFLNVSDVDVLPHFFLLSFGSWIHKSEDREDLEGEEGLNEGSIKDSGLAGAFELMKNKMNCAAMNANKTEKNKLLWIIMHLIIWATSMWVTAVGDEMWRF